MVLPYINYTVMSVALLKKEIINFSPQEWSYRLGRQKSFLDVLEHTRNILEVVLDNIYVDAKGKCHDKSDLSWNIKFTYIVSW